MIHRAATSLFTVCGTDRLRIVDNRIFILRMLMPLVEDVQVSSLTDIYIMAFFVKSSDLVPHLETTLCAISGLSGFSRAFINARRCSLSKFISLISSRASAIIFAKS